MKVTRTQNISFSRSQYLYFAYINFGSSQAGKKFIPVYIECWSSTCTEFIGTYNCILETSTRGIVISKCNQPYCGILLIHISVCHRKLATQFPVSNFRCLSSGYIKNKKTAAARICTGNAFKGNVRQQRCNRLDSSESRGRPSRNFLLFCV